MSLGTECVMIKVSHYDFKTKSIGSITLSIVSNDVSNQWVCKLKESSEIDISLKSAEFPFYSTCEDTKTCMLTSIFLGSDVHEGGCNDFEPSKLNNHIKSLINENYDINLVMIEHIAKKLSTSQDMIKTCSDAIMHEPCNEASINQCSQI